MQYALILYNLVGKYVITAMLQIFKYILNMGTLTMC